MDSSVSASDANEKIRTWNNQAITCFQNKDYKEAARLNEKAIKYYEAKPELDPWHTNILSFMHNLAECHYMLGDYQRALQIDEGMLTARKRMPEESDRVVESQARLVSDHCALGNPSAAKEVLDEMEKTLPAWKRSAIVLESRHVFASTLVLQKRFEEALGYLQENAQLCEILFAVDDPRRTASLDLAARVEKSLEDHEIDQAAFADLETKIKLNMRLDSVAGKLFDANEDGETDQLPSKVTAAENWLTTLDKRLQTLLRLARRVHAPRRVRIAILDTGVDANHPQVKKAIQNGQIKRLQSFVNSDDQKAQPCDPKVDKSGHGTHATSILLNVAPNAAIYVARTFYDSWSVDRPQDVAAAMEHAINNWEVDIISMSFGFPHHHPDIDRAIKRAAEQDILLFAAASNNGRMAKVAYPARDHRVFRIYSTYGRDTPSIDFNPSFRPGYGSYGILGEEVRGAWKVSRASDARSSADGPTKLQSGTSVATPIAAAVAALVLEFRDLCQTGPYARKWPLRYGERLKSFAGMDAVFRKMSENPDGRHDPFGGFASIVPWNVLDAWGATRDDVHAWEAVVQKVGDVLDGI